MSHSLKPTNGVDIVEIASRIGVPFVILLIAMTQLGPKIDHQTAIAEQTSAYLGVLVSRGPCSAVNSN